MKYATTTRKGRRFVLVPEQEFKELTGEFVALPPRDADGTRDALSFARASIANTIISQRKALGLSQAQLARQAKVPVETLNRIERATRTADQATIEKIDRALRRSGKTRARTG